MPPSRNSVYVPTMNYCHFFIENCVPTMNHTRFFVVNAASGCSWLLSWLLLAVTERRTYRVGC